MALLRSRAGRFLFLSVVLAVLLPASDADVQAARFNRVLDLGDKAPAWTRLPGVDGKEHSLDDLKSAEVVVVVFFCNHCPVAKAYEERLLKLAAETQKQSVKFILVSVSRYEADQMDEMKRRAAAKKYPFAYVQDVSQKLGREYGAYVTPQVFVLDRERTIAYMGAIDDAMDPEDASEHYLRNAISAAIAEQEPEVRETRPVGCHIEFE